MAQRQESRRALSFNSGQTVFWFGIYVGVISLALFLIPDLFLRVFQQPPTSDPWLRVMAVPFFNLAVLYTAIGRFGTRPILRMTATSRCWVILAFGALIVAGLAPPVILLFAVVDLFGAALTFAALRREDRALA